LEKTCDITYFLEGSNLSYTELNNCCVKEDTRIISGHILCSVEYLYTNMFQKNVE